MTIPRGALENTPSPPKKRLLGPHTGGAGRIYHSSPNSTDAFTKPGIPPAPSTTGAGLGARLRHCCPRAAAGGTARWAGASGCRGTGSPKPPGCPSTSRPGYLHRLCPVRRARRERKSRLVRAVANMPLPCPFRDEEPKHGEVEELPEAGCEGRGRFYLPGSPGGGHGLILFRHRSPHPRLPLGL